MYRDILVPVDLEEPASGPHGSVGGGILDNARGAGAGLVVLASRRAGARHDPIGANAVHVVRDPPCPVLVGRA